MKITRTLAALLAATLITALPLPAPAQFTLGVGINIGTPPPPLPYYTQPPAPYPNYQWIPGYWAWGQAGYYWVPGTWIAPPAVGLYWTPGYWGYNNGYYGWNNGYWGSSVGFYGGINYGYGYPGTGFYGGAWNGGTFAYNTAVMHLNRTVIHNTYYKTVIHKNVCNNCRNVSYNGGKGGISARPTPAQLDARRHGRPPTADQRNHARIAADDRKLYANVNHGKPPVTASERAFNDKNRPKDFTPVTTADKQAAQHQHNQNQGNAARQNQMQGDQRHSQMQGNPPKQNHGSNPPQHTYSSSGAVRAHPQNYGSNGNAPHTNSVRGYQGGPQRENGTPHQSGGGHPPSGNAENHQNGDGHKPPKG